jgi:hypothetical protein
LAPYIGQAVGEELDLMALIGGAEERSYIQWETKTWLRKRDDEKIIINIRRGSSSKTEVVHFTLYFS